jgi:hypothetical protein
VFENGQSIYYAGRVLVQLLKDPELHKLTGQIVNTSELGAQLRVADVDGSKFFRVCLDGVVGFLLVLVCF